MSRDKRGESKVPIPPVEKAIAWLDQLSERSFLGTESRLLTLFQLLRQMSEAASQTRPNTWRLGRGGVVTVNAMIILVFS
jgi:hypothetical protein